MHINACLMLEIGHPIYLALGFLVDKTKRKTRLINFIHLVNEAAVHLITQGRS